MRVVRPIGYGERAAFYETEYATTADHAFLTALVTPSVGTILEIPAGVGRNLDWLAATSRDVVLADLEPAMIARLRERIGERRAGGHVTALVGDMRCLGLPQRFDLIIVPQGGFQLLPSPDDALRALRALRLHLRHPGRLVLDVATFEAGVDDDEDARPSYFDPSVPNGQIVHEWTRSLRDRRQLTRRRMQQLEPDRLATTFFYRLETAGGSAEESSFAMVSRRYCYEHLISLVEAAGLRIEQVCRNYRSDPYRGHGHRMIFVLTVT